MIPMQLRGLHCPDRILVPQNAKPLFNAIQAIANQRQKETIVVDIWKSMISVQHKLNVAMYQAGLIHSLNANHYTLFELYPERLPSSDISYKICNYSMQNLEEYVLELTFFIETFAATVFSLFDVSGGLINHLYRLGLKEEEVDFKNAIWELQNQGIIDPSDKVFCFLFSYYSWKTKPPYDNTVPLKDVPWMQPMKKIRNRTTHRPITDVCDFNRRADIYSNFYNGVPETDLLLNRDLSPNTRLFDFVKEIFEEVELFVEELYFYLRQTVEQSGSLPIY